MLLERIISEGQRAIINRAINNVQPRVLRIDKTRGVLHWNGDKIEEIENEKIVLCFNGGNHFTAVRVDEKWVFYKGWFDKKPDAWRETSFARDDLLNLIKLSSFKNPQVSYVPKLFCRADIRNVMFDHHLLGIKSSKNDSGAWVFKLFYLENREGERATDWLGGKPWESIPARDWCRKLPTSPPLPFKKFALETMQDAVEDDREELEAREDWGIF